MYSRPDELEKSVFEPRPGIKLMIFYFKKTLLRVGLVRCNFLTQSYSIAFMRIESKSQLPKFKFPLSPLYDLSTSLST